MAGFIVPGAENASKEAIDLYLSVFDANSPQNRERLLLTAGVKRAPRTMARVLGWRSLNRATAAEVGLQALATVKDPTILAVADAAVASLRVARGLTEDRRTVHDEVIDELHSAAQSLTTSVSTSEALGELYTECQNYLREMRSGDCSTVAYMRSLRTHSLGVAGVLLQELGLVELGIGAKVRDFAISLGALHQITTDLRANDGSHIKNSLTRSAVEEFMSTESVRSELIDSIMIHSRHILDSIKVLREYYVSNPMLDEVLLRANITLRECAQLLNEEKDR